MTTICTRRRGITAALGPQTEWGLRVFQRIALVTGDPNLQRRQRPATRDPQNCLEGSDDLENRLRTRVSEHQLPATVGERGSSRGDSEQGHRVLAVFPKIPIVTARVFGMKRHIPGISNSCTENVLDYPYFPSNYDVFTIARTRVAQGLREAALIAARDAMSEYSESCSTTALCRWFNCQAPRFATSTSQRPCLKAGVSVCDFHRPLEVSDVSN